MSDIADLTTLWDKLERMEAKLHKLYSEQETLKGKLKELSLDIDTHEQERDMLKSSIWERIKDDYFNATKNTKKADKKKR